MFRKVVSVVAADLKLVKLCSQISQAHITKCRFLFVDNMAKAGYVLATKTFPQQLKVAR